MIKIKPGVGKKMLNIPETSGQEVVHPNDMKTFFQKPITKVRPDKSGRAGN
jgi:hypothetical protein